MDENGELAGAEEANNNSASSGGEPRIRLWAVVASSVAGVVAYAASLWLLINFLDIPVEKHVLGADIAAFLIPAMLLLSVSLRAKLEEYAVCKCFLLLCAALPAVTIPSHLLAQVILLPWLDRTPGIFMHIGLAMATFIIVYGAGWATYRAASIACGQPRLVEPDDR